MSAVRTSSGPPKLYNLEHGSISSFSCFGLWRPSSNFQFSYTQQKIMEYQDLKGKKAVVTGAGAGNNDFEIKYIISYYFIFN